MADKRETDLLAYILTGFVIAISGIAVGVASTNAAMPSSDTGHNTAIATVPTAAATPAPIRAPRTN
jgi:hypothetical protein